MNKEVSDALYMLLHCALKDKEYETQKEQFEIVYKHIEELLNKIDELEKYSRGNIEACENRLNSPFCNFERVTKELMIHKNYLEILKDSDADE